MARNNFTVDNTFEDSQFLSSRPTTENLIYVDIDSLVPHPENEERFSTEDIEDIYLSIKKHGLGQPLEVTDITDDQYRKLTGEKKAFSGQAYMILSGHRRWKSCKRINEEDRSDNRFRQLPCILMPSDALAQDALLDEMNVTIRQLNAVQQAEIMMRRWYRYLQENGKTHAKGAEWFKPFTYDRAIEILKEEYGYSRSKVQRYLYITKLPVPLKNKIISGQLPIRVLTGKIREEKHLEILDQVIDVMSDPGEDESTPVCILTVPQLSQVITGIVDGTLSGKITRAYVLNYLGAVESTPNASVSTTKPRKAKQVSTLPTFIAKNIEKYNEESVRSLAPKKKEQLKQDLREAISYLEKIESLITEE